MAGDVSVRCGVGTTGACSDDITACPARGFSRRRHVDLLRVSSALCPGLTPAGTHRG